MPRPSGKVVECGLEQARARLGQAQAFAWVAELALDDVHYQAIAIVPSEAKAAVAQARRMVQTVATLLA